MNVNTAIRNAFEAATIKRGTSAAIINSCAKAMQGNAGIVNIGKGWNAHLSYATAQKLKQEGVLV